MCFLRVFEEVTESHLYDIFSWWLSIQPQVVQHMVENTTGKRMLGRVDRTQFINMYGFKSGEAVNLPYISAEISEKYLIAVKMGKLVANHREWWSNSWQIDKKWSKYATVTWKPGSGLLKLCPRFPFTLPSLPAERDGDPYWRGINACSWQLIPRRYRTLLNFRCWSLDWVRSLHQDRRKF